MTSFPLAWDRAAAVLLAALALLALLTFRDYGVTWDADVHHWYGVMVLDYYLSGFADKRALGWLNLYLYGGGFDALAALANRYSTLGTYETRDLLNAAVGLLGLLGTWRLGRFLGGARAGFFALLLLATIPNYYGQMFNNPVDIPFAVAGIWTVHGLARLIPALPRPPWRLVIALGVAIGGALSVRVGGLLMVFYLMLALSAHMVRTMLAGATLGGTLATGARLGLLVALPSLSLAFAIMLLSWPWAAEAPIAHPLQALAYFSHVTFPFTTLFAGSYYPADHLPLVYLPTFILLDLPELTLLLILAALPLATWSLARRWQADRTLQYGLLLVAILFPVGYAVAIRAVLFDGMRHFLFVLPPIAVAAGLVLDGVVARLADHPFRLPVAGLGALWLALHLAIMVALHPDQYVYYNGLVGGVGGGQHWFKTDYWGNSYREATLGLVDYLRHEYPDDFEARRFTVADCGPPISMTNFLPPNLVYEPVRERADFFISFTKDDCDHSLPGKEIFRVERMGALLSIVLDRRERSHEP